MSLLDGDVPPPQKPAMIYKIFRNQEWRELSDFGVTDGAPIDRQDGYIHFSTAAQVAETAAKHFAGADDLWLAAIDEAALGPALKWEVSRGGAEFPHLYDRLRLVHVRWCQPLPLVAGSHDFGGLLA